MGECEVVVGAGTLRSTSAGAVAWPHSWTADGVTVEGDFTGGHLLHLAAAGCILNDVYREARRLHVPIQGVRVTASGGFAQTCCSTGVSYSVEVDSTAPHDDIEVLLKIVDVVAEIPEALRLGASVEYLGVTSL